MSHRLEDRIAALARRQHGVVTRGQLLELGLSPGGVRHRAGCGRLRRLHRGVYLVGPIMPDRARDMAAVLASGADAVLSHRSAAALWGLASPHDGDARVEVTVAGTYSRGRRGVVVRRVDSLERDERSVRAGIPVTAIGRTLVDFASVAVEGEVDLAVARAERERQIDANELAKLMARYGGRPGTRLLGRVLHQAGGPALTRSEAETRFRALLRKGGLPMPEANVGIGRYEVDFLWRDLSVAVEVDGYRFHGTRPSFEDDHRKTTFLAARGIQVIPVTWRQIVEDETATAVQLAQALVLAERR